MTVAILVPVLRRPHRVAPLLASIEAATPQQHRVLFIASPGDDAEHQAIEEAGADLLVLEQEPGPGDYARKINAGIRATAEPFVFLGADDLAFHPGWLPAALARMASWVGVVGTNDLGNPRVLRGEHATHSLVARTYAEQGTIDDPSVLLHEGYPHEYVDDELVATAKHRGAWAFAADSVVEHLHPNWHPDVPVDELYAAQGKRMAAGRRIFRRRERLWT